MYAHDIDIPFYRSSKTLKLVKPDPSQATITIEWLKQPNVTKYLGADFSEMTLAGEEKHLREMLTNPNCYSWMIALDGQIVGNIELNEIKELTEKYGVRAGVFCTLIGDPQNWGQGLGTCAKQVATQWAFEEGRFELLEAKAYQENSRSWRALEKLGFEYQGLEKGEVMDQPVTWKVYTLSSSKNPG